MSNVYNLDGTPYQTPQERATACVKRVRLCHMPMSVVGDTRRNRQATDMQLHRGWTMRHYGGVIIAHHPDFEGGFSLDDALDLDSAMMRDEPIGVAKE